jgi:acetolactate synthase regulatory subunit
MGPAGVGKTSLWQAFADYLDKSRGFTVRRVNMDPGSQSMQKNIDYDITSDISSQVLMKKQKLGPNGAILEACRQMSAQQDRIFQKILPDNNQMVDFLLIDTPGQLDSFILQPFGATFLNELNKRIPLSAIYLYDATALSDPVNVPVQLFLNAAATFQLQFEMTPCLSKADLADVQKVLPLLEDPQKLTQVIDASKHGVMSDFASQSLDTLAHFHLPVRVVPVSVHGKTVSGLDDLFALLEESGCACGDRQ